MRLLGFVLYLCAVILRYADVHGFKATLGRVYRENEGGLQDEVPACLTECLIAAEDKRFYRHRGIDFYSLARAVYRRATAGERIGGVSTLEQQFVRVLTGRREYSLGRKARELILSTTVESVVPKADIPRLYMVVAYFGWSMNGIHQACRRQGWRLDELSLVQAASLVARLKYPEPEKPSLEQMIKINGRQEYILRELNNRGRETYGTDNV